MPLLPAPQMVTGLKVTDGIATQLLSGQLPAAEAAVLDPDLLASAAIRKQVRCLGGTSVCHCAGCCVHGLLCTWTAVYMDCCVHGLLCTWTAVYMDCCTDLPVVAWANQACPGLPIYTCLPNHATIHCAFFGGLALLGPRIGSACD